MIAIIEEGNWKNYTNTDFCYFQSIILVYPHVKVWKFKICIRASEKVEFFVFGN